MKVCRLACWKVKLKIASESSLNDQHFENFLGQSIGQILKRKKAGISALGRP